MLLNRHVSVKQHQHKIKGCAGLSATLYAGVASKV